MLGRARQGAGGNGLPGGGKLIPPALKAGDPLPF